MDHESYLGDTLAMIAAEKAGILKPGVPAVVGPQQPDALAAITTRAAELGAPLLLHGRDWEVVPTPAGMRVEFAGRQVELPRPALLGMHQVTNAGLAVAAALALDKAAPDVAAIARGLAEARWPGRLQQLVAGPAVAAVPSGVRVWLDGGHNPAAGEALAESLPALLDGRPLHLVVGMLSTKDLDRFLDPLLLLAASLRFVPVPGEPLGRDPEDSASVARRRGVPAVATGSVTDALAAIAAEAVPPYDVLVCGSLYLAGEVLREHR